MYGLTKKKPVQKVKINLLDSLFTIILISGFNTLQS